MGSIGEVTQKISEFVAPKWGQKADLNEELVDSALKVNTRPLWTQMAKLNPPEPNPKCIPFIWRYDEVRPSLLRAGEVVSEQQAERRVLMLVNPARGIPSHRPKLDLTMLTYPLQTPPSQPTPSTRASNSSCPMKSPAPTATSPSPCAS